MKKWRSSSAFKIINFIVSILAITVLGNSFLSAIYMADNNVYTLTRTEMRQEQYDRNTAIYSTIAIAKRTDPKVKQNFTEHTAFRYGIIRADSLDGVDLSDASIYEDYNFKTLPAKDAVTSGSVTVKSFEVGPDTQYAWDARLMGYADVYADTGDVGNTEEVSDPIIAYYYDIDSGFFFYETEEALYRVNRVDLPLGTDGGMRTFQYDSAQKSYYNASAGDGDCFVQDYYLTFDKLDDTTYNWQTWEGIYLDQNYFEHGAIKFGHLAGTGNISNNYYLYTYDNTLVRKANSAELLQAEKAQQKNKTYFVVSAVEDTGAVAAAPVNLPYILGSTLNYTGGDLYSQADSFVNTAYTMKYPVIFVIIGSGILWILTLNFMFLSAGYKRRRIDLFQEDGAEEEVEEDENPQPKAGKVSYEEVLAAGSLQKFPIDILTVVLWGVITALCCLFYWLLYDGLTMEVLAAATVTFIVGYAAGFIWLEDFVIRVKLGRWWRNSVTYMILRAISRPFRILIRSMRSNMPLCWRVSAVYGAISLCELIGIRIWSFSDGMLYFVWLVEKVVVYVLLLKCALQIDRLKKAGKKMADGDLHTEVNTQGMYWDFKSQAENLNSIREGMGAAVAQKMKSERFKTELITNVSHDIKTPLTSIINYVDLLEKEELGNEKADEYLEVLSRQSARLKKLIEDLLEASKASTGNLEMHPEKLELGVFLEQTLGEFQEKLEQKGLQVVVQKPSEKLYIMADGRHLWRVVDNLLNNICKYAQTGTRVYISWQQEKGEDTVGLAVLTFKNVSAYELNISGEELMERFVRGDSSRNTEGSGLGLSIAQSLTELMKGSMELQVDGDLFKVILRFPVVE